MCEVTFKPKIKSYNRNNSKSKGQSQIQTDRPSKPPLFNYSEQFQTKKRKAVNIDGQDDTFENQEV